MISRGSVTLGILAGGRASRLGGVDKARVEYRGDSLASRTIAALGVGYADSLMSHPGASDGFAALGLLSVADLRPGFFGPLAGIEALLEHCNSDWLLTVPVDMRDIPGQLCQQILAAGGRQGAVLRDGNGLQPLVALWPVANSLAVVKAALDRGDGAVHGVVCALNFHLLDISPGRVGNLNTPSDFA